MKKNLLLIVFALLCFKVSSAQYGVPCTDLFISEYISPGAGHAGDKTIEIYNPSSTPKNLAGYKLAQYSNGTCTATNTFTFPNKILLSGDVYVINNGATGVDPSVVAARDTTWGSLNFNGNDWLLLKNALGDTLDIFGQMCINPGTAWIFPNNDSTRYMTLVRKASVHNGTKNFTQWQNDWIGFPMNTLSNLGSHTMNPCSSANPAVSFSTIQTTVLESAGTISLAVQLNSACPNQVTIDVQVALGSATSGSDYTYINQTLTFAPNVTSLNAYVTIIDDALIESTEAIKFRLLNPTNGAVLGTDSFEYVSITDNDFAAPTFHFSTPTFKTINESNITFPVLVNLGSPSANASTIDAIIKVANATPTIDYTIANNGTMNFAASSTIPDTIWVTIKDDCIHETLDSIYLVLRNPSGSNVVGTDSIFKIFIGDNDAIPSVSFSTTTPSLNENVGVYNLNVSIQTPNCDTTKVTVNVVGGSAISGTDYTATLPVTVVFLPNSTTTQVIPITIIDDAIVEGLDSIMLQLSNPTNGATILMPTKKIYIKDNDTLAVTSVSFVNSFVSKTESDGLVNIALAVTNPTNSAITVPFTISGACTQNVDDTFFTTSPLTVPANATSTNIQVNIIDDILVESAENVIITLGTPTNAVLGSVSSFTLYITDNDANGIASIKTNNKLSIYPNPVENQLTISNNLYSLTTIEVVDLLGRNCISINNHIPNQIGTKIINVGVNTLSKGIYFVRATDEKGNIYNSKFTKQ
ncbi:MAG: hypothetical protein RL708_1473 [Bacteroidota bacterium]|jgi:hypothetical protein